MSLEEANVFLNVEGEKIDDNLFVNRIGIKIPFGKDDNKMKIDVKDISTCSVCNKKLNINVMAKSLRRAITIDNTIEDKLIEIEINTVHKECKKLQDKYNKLNNQLLDVQFEIFCLSSIYICFIYYYLFIENKTLKTLGGTFIQKHET